MGKFIDLTGKQFGYWTVLEKSNFVNSGGNIMWVCQCKCGTIKNVSGTSLRNGKSQSCGCIHKEKVSIDLTGKRFGKLLVIRDTGNRNKKGHIIWECKCDCGNIANVSSKSLLGSGTQSCGCLCAPYKDISNQRFNNLIALEPTSKRSGNSIVWKCLCDCGNICEVSAANLQNGHTKSCGCLVSYGEKVIHDILQSNNIKFEKQKQFDTCRFIDTNTMAKFDFYIENKYLLEYDGSHHFSSTNRQWNTEENLKKVQEHDAYKNEWCRKNNIHLIRIPYTHLKDIILNDLLIETSKFIVV